MTPYTLAGLLSRWAAETPKAPAVIDDDRTLSYAELDGRANQLANILAERGIARGDRVGVFAEKSLESTVALYAIMKTGAAYVPIDSRLPVGRVRYIVENCGIKALVAGAIAAETWAELTTDDTPIRSLVALDADEAPSTGDTELVTAGKVAAAADRFPDLGVIDKDLAYILYTSGSTGIPKGVKLTHRNALSYVEWAVDEFGFTSRDRFSSHAPFHFDLSVLDLYAAAMVGAAVALVPPGASVFPIQISRFIDQHGITVWYSVPSILSMLLQRGKLEPGSFPGLRVLLFAGEVFPTKYLRQLMLLLPHVEFANLFGPTETNVCTYYRVLSPPDEARGDIPIGRAIANTHTFVMDECGNEVKVGEVGELIVRGPTVMQGYWGDPDKTATRLVPHPFGDSGDLAYRTGDLVREDENGDYLFLGRSDNQIKSRGYRIELGDIETALYHHPAVVECCVVPIPDDLVTNVLKAWVVVKVPVEEHELRSFCREQVPAYMVPDTIEFVESLPKTSTGKIDRNQLTR